MLLTATGMFAAIVVLLFAWLTVVSQSWFDPCANDGCGAEVRAVFVGAAVLQLGVLAAAVRAALHPGRSLAARLAVLVGAALAAPVLMAVGAYAGLRLA